MRLSLPASTKKAYTPNTVGVNHLVTVLHMGLETLSLRDFRPEDGVFVEGHAPDTVAMGITGEVDGVPVGYGGLHKIGERHWAFFHVADHGGGALLRERAPLFLHRIVLAALKMFDAVGIAEVWTICDRRVYGEKAAQWMRALGFVEVSEKPADVIVVENRVGSPAWVRRK